MKPTGRISLKGKHRVEKLYQQKCYSIEFKRDVLEYWNKASVELIIRKFWPDEKNVERQRKMIYKWKKNKSDLVQPHIHSQHLALTRICPKGLSTVLPNELEKHLANWVREYRSERIPVSNQMVQIRAL